MPDSRPVSDEGPFVPGPRVARRGSQAGPLSGRRFAVKDLFDVAGEVTGYGNPDWARTHPPASGTALVVSALLHAGADLVGKTKTVELAYGLTGENVWYGTPRNPAAPDRFPGGSSCGSASVVAAGEVDFALGSDTGGSVRIPASYCGLYGLRPSFGAISLAGACGLAPSLDTPGWFTRDVGLLAQVGDVLLPGGGGGALGPVLRVEEAWANADPGVAKAYAALMARIEARLGAALPIHLLPEGLDQAYAFFAAVQGVEAWATLGGWVSATSPAFGPSVGERFAAARSVAAERAQAGCMFRQALQARVRPLLAGGAVLAYPTSPCPAPLLTATPEEQMAVRARTIGVTAISGFCGLPELTIPGASVDGAPVGLSLVAAPGRDRALLALAQLLMGG